MERVECWQVPVVVVVVELVVRGRKPAKNNNCDILEGRMITPSRWSGHPCPRMYRYLSPNRDCRSILYNQDFLCLVHQRECWNCILTDRESRTSSNVQQQNQPIAGMRRLPIPSSASIPYQLRQTLFCYSTAASPPPQWLSLPISSSCHDRGKPLSTSTSTSTFNAASDPNDHGSSQNHDRNTGQQDKDRTIPALPVGKLPFKFETGIGLYAKRAPRPFPPPFLSPPSGSFSDPLSTHHRSRDRRPKVNGELIKGWTNGDDAAFASEYFIGANDGVGAWSARPRGHAGYVPGHSEPSIHHLRRTCSGLHSLSPPGYGRGSSCISGPPP